MRFKALRHQPSDAARKSGYDNEGQLPDTLPDSRSRPEAVFLIMAASGRSRLVCDTRSRVVSVCVGTQRSLGISWPTQQFST